MLVTKTNRKPFNEGEVETLCRIDGSVSDQSYDSMSY